MKTQRAGAVAVSKTWGFEMAEFSFRRVHSSQEDLLARLDRANKTIRTLEQRVAMQERIYRVDMQEKNRKIRELQSSLQSWP
jgi:hypothetical protein